MFTLPDSFVLEYAGRKVLWGPTGYIAYKRTYARPLDSVPDRIANLAKQERVYGTEEWWLTVCRVVEGTYSWQKKHCQDWCLPWDEEKAQRSAMEMYERMFTFKFLPPGRGLWMMGTTYVEKHGSCALNNCAFTSTEFLDENFAEPFVFCMDVSMLGVGVGFDTLGVGSITIQKPKVEGIFVVEDSREGWIALFEKCLNAYVGLDTFPSEIDDSLVRPAGAPIKSFGGTSSGSAPLLQLIRDVQTILDPLIGSTITETAIVDLFNVIGRCVICGNVRRSAEIALGSGSEEFLDLKDPEKARTRDWGWASNNSVVSPDSYAGLIERIAANGEPGIFWLRTARAFGRLKDPENWEDERVAGTNPCSEQSLEHLELCCVSHDTRIITREGYPRIGEVVGKPVDVWNGENWSTVTPFMASKNKKLYRVHLSDGSFLDVTDNHGWSVRKRTQKKFRRVDTLDLEPGMLLERAELSATEQGKSVSNAYQIGWFIGDGFIDAGRPMALVQESEYAVLPKLGGVLRKEQHPKEYRRPFRRVDLTHVIPLDLAKELRSYEMGLPEELFEWDKESLAEFFGGWVDTDGTLREQVNTDNYLIFSANKKKLLDAQMLLRKLGINYASIKQWREVGAPTNICKASKGLWALYIPSFEAEAIKPFLKKAKRFGDRHKKNNAYSYGAKVDRARRQVVVEVEELVGVHDTFCFTEPQRGMGIFGNCLTYQCLVESFPSLHDSAEDYHRTLKFAYLYAKTVTLIPTHRPRTNAITLRNRRIGCSMSGITENIAKVGARAHFHEFCDEGYDWIKYWDKLYAEWFCVPMSRKVTSVKPSGTVSKLPGVAEGIHNPIAEYYYQVIRFSAGSPFIKPLQEAGYQTYDVTNEPNTIAVYFPCKVKNFSKARKDATLWEQLELAAQMQYWWSDNQVSVTITFSEDEVRDIETALSMYENRLKSVSLLPLNTDTCYEHMPQQEITKEEYESALVSLKEMDLSKIGINEVQDKFCDGMTCEI